MDIVARIVLGVVLVGSGILLIWSGRAAASGRLKRNSIAGIRLHSTMVSDDAWLAAHQRAENVTVRAGYVSIASGLFALLPLSAPILGAVVIAGCCVMGALVLYGARVGSRAATATTDALGSGSQ